ncbi:hypothetical protein RB623_22035 [Mesorhizobium sp. LHD-90]|uniref:hypothetical protein n=1 Tax=Mesorhizobium sp. LHD-90 TaxID=3071414 RepID=UPI0027E13817|nr:hypothetical protein [Mesorhizobium sp. LHD-90]MDQ6436740.1 hypothetical protein [Mesorhizobium sp. LHD-90]
MQPTISIEDTAIWISHVKDAKLKQRLDQMEENDTIHLVADGVVGQWVKMRRGKDGRPTRGIRPDGEMKNIWNEWFRQRKGDRIIVHEVRLADDYLREGSVLFSEWESPEDEEAFRDL